MKISFPVIELVDRLTIALIKFEKTGLNQDEVNFYQNQVTCLDLSAISDHLDLLQNIHISIWDLEKELKSGCENQLSLEEIGRRAIKIRNLNNKRVALKNKMADILGCPVREIKVDHLSQ